ncbi:MAG: hypothetical protein JW999_01490 [Methanotrichaceae archaeon]|nr:hypothetical protein [Methanotrichaceae archaeon]
MLYLGEYEEETAKEIKSYLDKAGLKVESKPCLVMEEDATYTIKDRLSGIKELIEDTSQIERYLSALRSVLPQATPENFEDLFLKEMESLKFSSEEWTDSALSTSRARFFANMVLFANDIKIGEPFENKLDDPVLEIMVEPEDYDPRPKQLKCDIDFYLEKAITIFVDEFTTPLASEVDDEFWDAYPSEAQRLKALGLLIEKLATSPSSRKMDFAQFAEECNIHLEDEERSLNVYGDDAAEELARVLEKSGVLKRKGEKVKWRNKD